MTGRVFHVGLLGLVVIAAAGGYTLRRNIGSHGPQTSDCMHNLLRLSGQQCAQLQQDDPGFQQDAETLAGTLAADQQTLIALVSDTATSAEQIRAQAQVVVDAHGALTRRIVQHLLAVRRHVNIHQCRLLNQLYTEMMQPSRDGGPGRYRQRRGRGGPWGQGPGRGRRQRHRYGQLAPTLGLTEAQQTEAARIDPTYDSDAAQLATDVRRAHTQLVQGLEDPNTAEVVVEQALGEFLTLRAKLEMRTVDYVLSLRPMLSAEQQQRLIGLSRQGRRWRGGRS
jgi:hypothetical protein